MSAIKKYEANQKGFQNLNRKPYSPPKLNEYGQVEKLTQGLGGTGRDALGQAARR